VTDTENRLPYILVADDDSSAARAAANAAFQIARNQNLAIRGLYVVEEALALDTYANYHAELPILASAANGRSREPRSRAELMRWFKNQGKAALRWLETAGADAGVTVSTKLLAGGVSELVLRDAAQAQLLAIGRRGHGHKDDSGSLGHNFRKIAHHAHRPMLVGGRETPTLHRILVGYHGRAHADEALAWAARLQRALSAEMIVLNVCEDAESCQDRMGLDEIKARLAQGGVDAYRFVTGQGRPAAEMAAIAAANNVDLIIVGRYRHQALVEWLAGSTVDELLRATTLPVLIA
jgi:nucleotide-binding universal stress UspA family protein